MLRNLKSAANKAGLSSSYLTSWSSLRVTVKIAAGSRQKTFIYLLAVSMAFLHLFLVSSLGTEILEPFALEMWFAARGREDPPDSVVVVGLDEASYRELNLSPIVPVPRKVMAELLIRLNEYGVRRVALDILFSGPSPDPAGDEALAEALSLNQTILVSNPDGKSAGGVFAQFASRAVTAPGLFQVDGGVVRRFMVDEAGPITFSEAAAGIKENRDTQQRPGPRDFVNYYGPRRTIPFLSLYKVLHGPKAEIEDQLKGRIVFVGLAMQTGSAAAPVDEFITSFKRSPAYGAQVHATMAANLIKKDWIQRIEPGTESAIFNALVLVLVLAIARVKPPVALGIWGAGSILWVSSSYILFLRGLFIPCVTAVGIVLPLAFLLSAVFYYVVVARDESRLRSALSLYLAPQMVSEVLRNRATLELGGEEREVAILFTDIEGYTAWSETLRPLEITRYLNRYFTAAADVVLESGGTLVKFIGDSLFAVWGAPLAMPDSAQRAMLGVLEMQRRLKDLAMAGEIPPLKTRFGLNYGWAVVGNTGSASRFDYTASGDAVNLASRLEQLNKQFGTSTIFTASLKARLKTEIHALDLGVVRVFGKKNPTTLHGLFQEPLDSSMRTPWNEAVALFQNRNWDKSREKFHELQSITTLTKASEVYLKALDQFHHTPPDESWAGELVLLNK